MKHLLVFAVLAFVCLDAVAAPPGLYTIPSWGDYAVVYAEGSDPAMDSPEAMEHMFAFWKARGFTGVFLRSDLQQYDPFVKRNPRLQMNPALAMMWRHVDVLGERFDYFAAAQKASERTGLEFWVYHPHIYSDGAPVTAGVDGPGRMVPWSYESKVLAEHPELVTVDRRGRKYWMVPEYAYPEARRAKVGEFVHMAKKYGIKHFIANMRSEVSQLQDAADKADRYGFNAPVVEEMKKRHGVDIMTDARFDVDAPTFDPHDAMVEKWRDMRGEHLTQLYRELRAGLRAVDPRITLAITLAGEHIGPPLGNWRTDWRTWVDEGLVDHLISPVFFEATLDHDADKKGYLTNVRAGVGTVPYDKLKEYIKHSKHPEIQILAVGGPPYFFTPSPVPPLADGMQCDAWYGSYHLAWHQRWEAWQKDLREFGHIRFIEQNFDGLSADDIVQPSGGWGGMAYIPKLRACPGAWWRLGTGSDARPFAQAVIKHGSTGQAIQLTGSAEGDRVLTGWHNCSPDRSRYAMALDTSMTSGRCTFDFWLWRKSADSACAAYLQGDNSEFEVGVQISPGSGKISCSTGTLHGAGKWVETNHVMPVGEWQKFSIDVDLDQLNYRAQMGDREKVLLCDNIPLGTPKKRFVELPGVNIPIAVPVFKEFKSVLFVPSAKPGNVTVLDDVAVHWQPANPFGERGGKVEFSEDFESRPVGAKSGGESWSVSADKALPGEGVISDTSYGAGVKSLRVGGSDVLAVKTPDPLKTGQRLTMDLDFLLRSGEHLPSIMPGTATKHPHGIVMGWKNEAGTMIAGIKTGTGAWQIWKDGQWHNCERLVHYEVWNHLQLVLDQGGDYHLAVQPLGQVAADVGRARITKGKQGTTLTFFIESSGTEGHISCYDNVLITSGAPAAKAEGAGR